MKIRDILIILIISTSSVVAQTQSWQWIKAGGSSSDNASSANSAECRISGCDAKGNVYAVGAVNGLNMVFDTFSCAGTYPNIVGDAYPGADMLLFSYDCSGNMRWAEHIGDEENVSGSYCGAVTDVYGNTYIAHSFSYGVSGSGPLYLFLGDSVFTPPAQVIPQLYLCMVKYDSLGRIVWFKNFEEDTAFGPHSSISNAYGLRMGSSGNLWMACVLDSNYAISPNLHTTKYGKYNVEVDPTNGSILSGYYIAQVEFFGDANNPNVNYDLDEHENYYETGAIVYDTLRLLNQNFAPNENVTPSLPFLFSLDKHGDFRFILCDTAAPLSTALGACKYDFSSHQFLTCMTLDTFVVFGRDTFMFQNNKVQIGSSKGLLCIDTSGNILWGKYVTAANSNFGYSFQNILTPHYISNMPTDGSFLYNNVSTITEGTDSCLNNCTDFYRNIMQIDQNGNYLKSYNAHLGTINTSVYAEAAQSGATDWRGNLYLGGSITNYMTTPVGTVTNTDLASGNFFIAKIGISDCSCPTPGVQFTQTASGGSVNFYGNSINHNDSIHWEFGDGTVGSSDTMTHVYSHNGTYNVTAIAYSGCGVDSITKQIIVTSVGIKTIEPSETKLYPNPAMNSVALEVSGPATLGFILANGASVWNVPVQIAQQGTYVFDVSKYSSGVYYFIVQYTNGKTDVMQVVKE